jgi:hypothetical protein
MSGIYGGKVTADGMRRPSRGSQSILIEPSQRECSVTLPADQCADREIASRDSIHLGDVK